MSGFSLVGLTVRAFAQGGSSGTVTVARQPWPRPGVPDRGRDLDRHLASGLFECGLLCARACAPMEPRAGR